MIMIKKNAIIIKVKIILAVILFLMNKNVQQINIFVLMIMQAAIKFLVLVKTIYSVDNYNYATGISNQVLAKQIKKKK